jgi:glycosyltransferase involved in cell wall biosynthesis
MPDMIIHKKNGYLAEPHSVESLAEGILWVTNSADRLNHLSKSSRDSAVDLFNPKTIADQYLSLYSQAMS